MVQSDRGRQKDVCSRPQQCDLALDAKSGAELWIHPTEMRTTLITSRGNYLLAYLSHPERAPAPAAQSASAIESASTSMPPEKLRYRSSFGFMFSRSGLPAIAPPWTTHTAYNSTGTSSGR